MTRMSFLISMSVIGCASAASPAGAPPTAATATPPPAPTGTLYTRIPSEIGAFRITERATVRGLPTDSLFRFRDGSRTILTVIVYEVAEDVRVDADSQQWTRREGEKFKAVQEIRVRQGQLAAYVLAFSDTTRFAAGEHQILEHAIATPIRFANGAIAVDMQYLYLIGGKFVKVRATMPEQGWQQTQVPSFARTLALRMAGGT